MTVGDLVHDPGRVGPGVVRDAAWVEEGAGWFWRRTLPPDLATYLDAALHGEHRRVEEAADATDLAGCRGAAERLLDRLDLEPGTERDRLADDLVRLGGELAARVGVARVLLRLERSLGGSCPVFHQDNKVLRLLCTYAGAGTEWLREADLDRSELGLRGRTPDVANWAIARGTPVRAQRGEVVLARGARSAGGRGGLVHRSPPASSGPRLLLVVDPVEGHP